MKTLTNCDICTPDYKRDNSYYCSIINTTDVAIMAVSLSDSTIVQLNHSMAWLLSLPQKDIIGKVYSQVFWEDFTVLLSSLITACQNNTPSTDIYYWVDKAAWMQVSVRQGTLLSENDIVVISLSDVTQMRETEEEYRYRLYYDMQLNVPNGQKLEVDVAALKDFSQVALIHFDIDRFSSINDIYGWDAGDYLLIQIRNWILSTAVDGCQFYRITEDKFAMLIHGISFDAAKERAEEVLDRFTMPWHVIVQDNSTPLYCTVTMALLYGHYLRNDTRNQMFRTLKLNGKPGSFTVYNSETDAAYKNKLLFRQALITCLQQDDMPGFYMVYQPIVEAQTGRWVGVEALCRWHAPEVGDVPAQVFIEGIEQLGLIDRLDTWVLDTAMRDIAASGLCQPGFSLHINVSPLQMGEAHFEQKLRNIISKNKFPRENLCLEITEGNRFPFNDTNIELLASLQQQGIRISLDDFGTGYSSFQNLMKLPAHSLKTEKTFIDNIVEDSFCQHLVKAILDLAHTANIKMVAEGVETEAQREILASYGVDMMQGYLFSRPLTPEGLTQHRHKFSASSI